MIEHGYGGRILYVDLTEREFQIKPLKKGWIKNVIGGRAANTKRLLEELDTSCDPLGPENMLIFGVGPLTGSILPASAYYTISARSPLTGILGDSAAGGQFGARMKSTGFDQIIITGRGDPMLYLLVTDSGVRFVQCPELEGKNILETTEKIRKNNRDHSIEVAAIGVAGEREVPFACVVSSGNRVNGRTGMGAVMGSKNLKALAVAGNRPVTLHDPLAFSEEVKNIEYKIKVNPEYDKRHRLGTTMLMKDLNGIGILPTNHFRKGVCDYVDDISGEILADRYKVKNKSCYNCSVHCSRYYICQGTESEGPEFETLCSFTSRIGVNDLEFALDMNYQLNQTGLDSISTGEVIGWLMECQERELIKPEDVDGLNLGWGDKEKVRELVHMIAHREGIGKELAQGATKFSEKFGEEAQKLVMQVKGLDIICGDPRGIKAYGLTYAVSSRGADHLRAEPYFELTEQYDIAEKRFGTPKAADRLSEEGKAELVTYSEKIALLTDSLTICKNIGLCMDVINFENSARLLYYGTGIEYNPDELETLLGESVKRDLVLNEKFGIKTEDTLPDRFTKEPLKEGPTKGSVVNIEKMVEEYRRLHDLRNV